MTEGRRYYIKTYGCAMNVADAAKLEAVLAGAGYAAAGSEKKADIILVVTCVVRQHAEDRAAGYITSLKGLKEKNPSLKIALCGCMVTEPERDVKKQFPHVDWFIPPNSPEKLRQYLNSPPLSPSLNKRGGNRAPMESGRGGGEFVTISHGCDNYCSYCVVPYVRGREYSRPMDEVLAEIKELVEQGVTDIILLGQNVNSYKYGLADLLIKIQQLVMARQARHPSHPELRRGISHSSLVIRFLTSHPRDMSDEIIEAVAELPYVAKEFLLPLQSGDDEILKKMNRGYTLAHFIGRVKKIRSLMPTARVTTDILVGFPGETEEQFQNTLRAVEEIRFDEVHMFAYSERPGTTASKLPDKLSAEIKQLRLQRLIKVVREIVQFDEISLLPGG